MNIYNTFKNVIKAFGMQALEHPLFYQRGRILRSERLLQSSCWRIR